MQFVVDKLRDWILTNRVTMLGAGPMSVTCTRAVVALANHYKSPIALIPSRRQVEAECFGGGYVENWSTDQFAKFVRSIDQGGYVLLSRDHSGPWQSSAGPNENRTLPQAMEDAKVSLADDIDSGFDLLHIDPSQALVRGFSEDDVDDMAVELIAFCVSQMSTKNHCAFEVGTDEQSAGPDSLIVTHARMRRIIQKLKKADLPLPLFYVAQTGTKVLETRNVGSFDQPLTMKESLPATVQLPAVLDLCARYGLLLKEHNADYLSDAALRWHRKFGIHAANVAPEFGVTETRSLLSCLDELELIEEKERFVNVVLRGGKWKKWLAPESKATENERVEMAGHYHFSDPEVREIRVKAGRAASSRGLDLEARITREVAGAIDRYLQLFGYGGTRA